MSEKTGLALVFLTAVVSGASIFANNFAVSGFNAFSFTFLKAAVVSVFLFSAILLLKEFNSIKALTRKQLLQLASIGLLGGSIPFLLFFHALQLTTAVNAGFLHKTIFIWAALFGILFLKEKVSKTYAIAAAFLIAGNFLLFSISSFGFAEALILIAAMLWAAENTISKRVLSELSGSIVAFSRMFFGSVFILAFLALTNQVSSILAISLKQSYWVLLTSAFLFAYVFTFYSGLKHLPLHKATAVLLLAQPITVFLSFVFLGKEITLIQGFALLLTLSGIFLIVGFGFFLRMARTRGLSIAADRA
ncbi:MAG: DMT family transporter [Candidatus Diapherotrites archaeon]|uniref:DMT family transporter n=1 Tax=Candidatus Iainarchaeum sp. TaxID=3101447 RepID=A0A938YTM8_9ARCH|nr:DMT family transporter [Candidatus Diapherotrites archaeon]